jgi:hypothetical protein
MGKELFYREWLGEKYMSRFIFSRGLTLREDLCLISSGYTKLVFGPCTGLLHCASGIYNNFRRHGLREAALPALIVYTGPWDAQFWWGKSPLVDCLLLPRMAADKQLAVLNDLDENEQRLFNNRLDCSEYTALMLTGYIDNKLNK